MNETNIDEVEKLIIELRTGSANAPEIVLSTLRALIGEVKYLRAVQEIDRRAYTDQTNACLRDIAYFKAEMERQERGHAAAEGRAPPPVKRPLMSLAASPARW